MYHAVRLQQPGHRLTDCLCRLAFNLQNERESGLTFDETHYGLPEVLADDSIGYPVTDPAACFDDLRTLFDGE